MPLARAQPHSSVVLQKGPGSRAADQASCPEAKAPAPVPQLGATLLGALAALGVLEALDGAGAGAGATAKGQDRNARRWGPETTEKCEWKAREGRPMGD